MGDDTLRERLLAVMDNKDHWAWPYLTRPGLSRAQLLVHFRHEYQVYVRDFPVLLARVLGQGPPADVRRALAENLYEEQTGGLSLGAPHPELFLEMMDGLGIRRADVEDATPPIEPEAIAYRAMLDDVSARPPWVVGAAVLTIFVEGSVHERAELEGRRALPPIEEAIREHPMVKHYGCPPARLRLARAHRAVEGGHRQDAWAMVLGAVGAVGNVRDRSLASLGRAVDTSPGAATGPLAAAVADAVTRAHVMWLAYRDGVARAMGLSRDGAAGG